MLNQPTYTEEDIQNYLDGNFPGDTAAFENWLQHNKEAQQHLHYYRLLYTTLKEETQMSLSFNLQDAVVTKVMPVKTTRLAGYRLLNGLVMLIAAGVIAICWRVFGISTFFESVSALYILCIPLLIIFLLIWHSIELMARKERYQFYQGIG